MMTMLKGRRIGLAAKVNALIVGSILATVLGTGALTLRNMTAESFQQLLSDGATLAAMISQNSEYAIYTENHDALMRAGQCLYRISRNMKAARMPLQRASVCMRRTTAWDVTRMAAAPSVRR